MVDDTFKQKLQGVLDRTNEFLGYSVDHVVNIRDDVMGGLRDLYDELDEVRKEVNEVLTANDAVTEAYKQARKTLVNAEIANDYDTQAKMYQEAERYMRLRAAFEERERYLRRRRDDLEREKIRMERIMGHSTNTMGKLRVAIEVVKNRIDSLDSIKSSDDIHNVVLGLQFAENENKRLAREIHDGPIQQFAAAILSFEYLERIAARGDKDALNQEIARIKDQLQEALVDFRGFLLQLQPLGLDKGLGRAVVRLAENYRERHKIDFEVDISQEEDSFSTVLRSNLFRVVQEAAGNALRHGRATKIFVEYDYDRRDIHLKIRDNGCGFDVERSRMMAAERGSFGLSNMAERIHFVNGTLHIQSVQGKGTEITIKVPIGGDEE
ncbi:sensor histidine kinase [Synergistaceae bacterium OttesenSCG-928-I11]|nr:sensor histidine kinase [Synergistaceae bacterium OttesenSCG-928-I11]